MIGRHIDILGSDPSDDESPEPGVIGIAIRFGRILPSA